VECRGQPGHLVVVANVWAALKYHGLATREADGACIRVTHSKPGSVSEMTIQTAEAARESILLPDLKSHKNAVDSWGCAPQRKTACQFLR
jgi:hypothetical protein